MAKVKYKIELTLEDKGWSVEEAREAEKREEYQYTGCAYIEQQFCKYSEGGSADYVLKELYESMTNYLHQEGFN